MLTAVAVVATTAGCGSDDTASYRSESQKAAAEFKQSVARAGRKIPSGSTLRQRVPGLEAYKRSVDRLAKRLDTLDPPGEVKKLHDQAVATLHSLSGHLASFEKAARAGDKAAAQSVAVRLASDQARLRGVLDAIDRRLSG